MLHRPASLATRAAKAILFIRLHLPEYIKM